MTAYVNSSPLQVNLHKRNTFLIRQFTSFTNSKWSWSALFLMSAKSMMQLFSARMNVILSLESSFLKELITSTLLSLQSIPCMIILIGDTLAPKIYHYICEIGTNTMYSFWHNMNTKTNTLFLLNQLFYIYCKINPQNSLCVAYFFMFIWRKPNKFVDCI